MDLLFELDESFCFENVIAADETLLFMPKELILGKKLDELFEGEEYELFRDALDKVSAGAQKEYVRYFSSENLRWFEAEVCFRKSGKGGYIVSISEITSQKKLEDELTDKTVEAENFFNVNLDLLCIADMNGYFLKVNKEWENVLGYTVKELENRRFLDFVHPEDLDATLKTIAKLKDNVQVLNFVNRYKPKEGEYRFIEWRSQPYSGLIYAAARDITDRKQTEEKLRNSEERLEFAIRATRSGLWDWNIREGTVYYSSYWKSMLGYEEGDIENTFDGWKNLWHPDDATRIERAINDYLEGRTIVYEIDHRLRCKNGEWRWVLTRGELQRDPSGEPLRWVGTNIDITQLKEAEGEVLFLSFHDPLTGLYNRRFYNEELKRLDTRRNLPLSLIMADVNGLKLVNDAFGHLVGDKLLKKVAEVLKSECRNDEIIARIGGDEFVILLPKSGPHSAECLMKRLKSALRKEVVDMMELSVSMGWAVKTLLDEDTEEVFRRAEDNMYQQKLREGPIMKEKAIKAVLEELFEKYPAELEHAEKVSELCEQISKKLGFNSQDINEIKLAGRMHDVGKISLGRDILLKPDRLNEFEWNEIKRHPETGFRILNSMNELARIAKYTLHHHEYWDGTGYPSGLKGEEIPLQSRIIAVASAFAAMTTDRPYCNAVSRETAIDGIQKRAGTQFDPEIVRIFETIMDKVE